MRLRGSFSRSLGCTGGGCLRGQHFAVSRSLGIALGNARGDVGCLGLFPSRGIFEAWQRGLPVGRARSAGAMRGQPGVDFVFP